MPEDLKVSQISSSPLPPPFRGLHSPGVRKHCQIIFTCYFWKSSVKTVVSAMHKFSQPNGIPGNRGSRVSSLVVAAAAGLSSACDVFVLTRCDAFMPRGPDTLGISRVTFVFGPSLWIRLWYSFTHEKMFTGCIEL